jgi:hypothetical protein
VFVPAKNIQVFCDNQHCLKNAFNLLAKQKRQNKLERLYPASYSSLAKYAVAISVLP